jgi:Gluconate 2-dehydrogenase subunit 3
MDSTRRTFLGVSVVAPTLVSTIQSAAADALPQAAQTTLSVVIDLVIPAGDGMPSASEAGGLAYLERLMQRDKDAAANITKGLAVLEAFSGRTFEKRFTQLSPQDQISVLKQMEDAALGAFDGLRAYVYESYYTQPQIWKLIGYELYPTDHAGPHLPSLDESLLADVRKMPKLYRDA